ncbi:hypothetical protein EST38_g9761 [Candolleomyces aberdarensis]|uniref:Uncharacterized protein n=1 Tax=Candolleomyces aberdarensis TaxID=2316362 RepID=A0A4Q2DBB9_9AGAR|nr:hypothetical protein EST38_g9761 [Candolleomyces aberdarensis]
MDRFVCLKQSEVVVPPEGGEDEESSSDDDDDGESSGGDEDDEDIWYGDEGEEGDEGRRGIVDDEGVESGREEAVEEDDIEEKIELKQQKGKEKEKAKKKKKSKKETKDDVLASNEPGSAGPESALQEPIDEDDSTDLRKQATSFMSTSKVDPATSGRSEEDILSTPLPGETVAMFYSRSRTYLSFLPSLLPFPPLILP